MLLENPSSYLAFEASTYSEPEFLRALVQRTGCGLLLDVNNVFVSATNLGYAPQDYIDAFPLEAVGECISAAMTRIPTIMARRF